MVYKVGSGTDRAVTQRNPVSKIQSLPRKSPKGRIHISVLMKQEKNPCNQMESVWIAYTSSISQLSLWHYQTESFYKIVCWSFSYPSRNFLNILLKFGQIIKLINGHRGSNKFFQKIENIIDTLIKIFGQYFKKSYSYTKYLWVLTINQPWNMELIMDTF